MRLCKGMRVERGWREGGREGGARERELWSRDGVEKRGGGGVKKWGGE